MHTYQHIIDHKSPTDHYRHISQLLTSMRRRALKGVTCRRVLESDRYRSRRRSLSDSALRSGWRHQRRPSLARVLPRQTNLKLPRPRLRPCPRPAAYRQGTGLPMRMRARRCPSWVCCLPPFSKRLFQTRRGCSSKRRWCLRPILPARLTNRRQTLRSQFRMQPRLRRPYLPSRLGRRSSVG
jgi:hypothetical protein